MRPDLSKVGAIDERVCLACGQALEKRARESNGRFAERMSCGGPCSPDGKAYTRAARDAGISLAEYMARRRQANVPPPATTPDTRTELQKLRDKWAERLLEPDPDASTRLYRTIAGAKGRALGMGRFNGRRAAV